MEEDEVSYDVLRNSIREQGIDIVVYPIHGSLTNERIAYAAKATGRYGHELDLADLDTTDTYEECLEEAIDFIIARDLTEY